MMSAKKVSSGSAIISAMTRGSTSTSIGSRPSVRMRVDLLVDLHGADLRR